MSRESCLRLLVGTLVMIALLGLSLSLAAATLVVDMGDPDCDDEGGKPYCTIGAAVDDAAQGDRIKVGPGDYGPFVLYEELVIDAERGDLSATGGPLWPPAALVPSEGSGSVLQGFRVEGSGGLLGGAGIILTDFGQPVSGVELYQNLIEDNTLGVGLLNATGNQIGSLGFESPSGEPLGNLIAGNGIGIGLLGIEKLKLPDLPEIAFPTTGNYIEGNRIEDNVLGVGLLGAEDNYIRVNEITGNSLAGVGIVGIEDLSLKLKGPPLGGILPLADEFPSGFTLEASMPAGGNRVVGNVLIGNGLGVGLLGGKETLIADNTIRDNYLAGVGIVGAEDLILRLSMSSAEETETTQSVTGFNFWGRGRSPADGNEIASNEIGGNTLGVGLLGGKETLIAGNTITDNALAGVGIVGIENISLNVAELEQEIDFSSDFERTSYFGFSLAVNLSARGNEVLDNVIGGNTLGVGLLGGKETLIAGNTIAGNVVGVGEIGGLGEISTLLGPLGGVPDLGLFGGLGSLLGLPLGGVDFNPWFNMTSEGNEVRGNLIARNKLAGLLLLNTEQSVVAYNDVVDTAGLDLSELPFLPGSIELAGMGVFLTGAEDVVIRNNVIGGNDVGIVPFSEVGEGASAHFNSIVGNEVGVFRASLYNLVLPAGGEASGSPSVVEPIPPEELEPFDATLNWWGDSSGPGGEGPGSGDPLLGGVIYSPWLGDSLSGGHGIDADPTEPGVQLPPSVTIIVDDVGPVPTTENGNRGYLNQAIWGANELPGPDRIILNHGSYSMEEPIVESCVLSSETGSTCNTVIKEDPHKDVHIGTEGVFFGHREGFTSRGFTVEDDIVVDPGVNAAEVHLNWNDLHGEVRNKGEGTLDAAYNWWGDLDPADDVQGQVGYHPYLPEEACTVANYMEKHELEEPKAAIAGMMVEDADGGRKLVALLISSFQLKPREAEELIDDLGYGSVREAYEKADGDYDLFLDSLGVSSI